MTDTHQPEEDSAVSDSGDPAPAYITGAKLAFMVFSLAAACFLILLDTAIVATAVPKITDDFHSLHDVGWYASAYMLGCASLQLLTGKLYQLFNLKWTFIAFFAVFELGSALCGAAQSSNMLIIGRAVAGIGGSGLVSGALTILAASVPLARRPPLVGLIMGIGQLGVVLGPIVGGAFTTGYTWRWCFYVNLPLGALVAIPLVLLRVPEQVVKAPPTAVLCQLHRHLDFIGFILLASAIIMLLLALQFGGNRFPWNSAQIIGLFSGAGATCLVWLVWNAHRGPDAMLPLAVAGRRRVWVSGLNCTLLMTATIGSAYFLPIYFQAVKGASAVLSGVYLLAMVVPQLASAIIGGILVPKVGYVPPFSLFSATLLAIGTGLFSLFQPDTPVGQWIGFQIIAGLGRGCGIQMPIVAVEHAVPPAELATGLAFIVWCQMLGPAVFLSVFNTIFDISMRHELHKQAPQTDASAILAAGATGFRQIVTPAQLPDVLVAYANSIDTVFYAIAAAAGLCWVTAWGMGWNKLSDTKHDSATPGAIEKPLDTSEAEA